MTTPDAEGMFALFDQYPELMPQAEGLTRDNMYVRQAMRKAMGYPCIHCGKNSTTAMVATHTLAGLHWIDLCDECTVWVREAIARCRERSEDAG